MGSYCHYRDICLIIINAEGRRKSLEILLEKWKGVEFRDGDVVFVILLAIVRMDRDN